MARRLGLFRLRTFQFWKKSMPEKASSEIAELRKKMIELGEESLSFVELLALALGKLPNEESPLAIAQDSCSYFGSIEAMSKAKKEDFLQIEGIGEKEARFLFSLLEKIGIFESFSEEHFCFHSKIALEHVLSRFFRVFLFSNLQGIPKGEIFENRAV